MSNHYLLIKEIDIHKASAMNNYLVTGSPSLTSYAGYTDAIKIEIQNTINKQIKNINFSVIIHEYTFNEGIESHVSYKQNEKPTGSVASLASMKVEHTCNIKASFIINFDLEDVFLESNSELIIKNKEELNLNISKLRMAGGHIKNTELNFVSFHDDLLYVMKSLQRASKGYFLKSADDLMIEYTEKFEGSALKALTYALEFSKMKETEDNKKEFEKFLRETGNRAKRRQLGWIVPTNVGYLAITEELNNLKGARSENAFVYVEPITSLIECVHTSKIIREYFKNKHVFNNLGIFFTSTYTEGEYRIKSINNGEF